MSDIHRNIRKYRTEKLMTLEQLAQKLNTSRQTIQRYETGEIKSIPYDKIIALSDALEVTPTDLMGWKDMINADPDAQAEKDADLLTKFYSLNSANQNAVITMIDSLLDSQT